MDQFLALTVSGLVTAALFAVAASGLVLTYTTSGIFNFAHGAMGMFAAFTYWQLRVEWGWPAPIALIMVLGVLAPLTGAFIERVVFRGLENVTEVTKLVVSIAVLFGFFQGALIIWPPGQGRPLPGFFQGNSIDLGFINLEWHDALILVAAALVAVGLRSLLYGSRTGISMRAVVDDRSLTELNGGRPVVASMLAWGLGTSLAALAGILLAGSQGSLSHIQLTLLVINAYAAAMFGRLRSLSLTFVGALVLGLGTSYAIGYLDLNDIGSIGLFGFHWVPSSPISLNGLRPALPLIALFIVLLFLPALRVRAGGQVQSREIIPRPPVRRWLIGAVALGAIGYFVGTVFSGLRTFQLGQGMALGIIMLSLVPLTGWAGQISLAPMAFAGIGAVVMGQFGGDGTLWGLVLAVAVPALVGALVALPTLRLGDLYLALATAAFAVTLDAMFFNQRVVMPNNNLGVPRLDLGPSWLSFDDDRAFLVLLGVTFGLVAAFLVVLRRGEFGRRLLAMKSSDAACVTLGLNLRTTRLQVFALSAGIAGLGGALYGAQLNSVSPDVFQFINGLPVVLLAVIGGIAAVGGALFGGITFAMVYFIIPDLVPALENWLAIGPAFAGVSLGRNPNGAVNETVRSVREIRSEREAEAQAEAEADGVPPLELMGIDGFSQAELDLLDQETGLNAEPLYAPVRGQDADRTVDREASGATSRG
jgi:branched-chain amino acid transport system permease protein